MSHKRAEVVTQEKRGFDPVRVRRDFPCLQQKINGKPLAFLDTAASAQKPRVVIESLHHVYSRMYSNVHRGAYYLSDLATTRFEETREKTARLLNAASSKEIVFTKSATEGLNLLAYSLGKSLLEKDSEVLISIFEHHANIVPWQQVCREKGAQLRVVPLGGEEGEFDREAFRRLLTRKTKIVSMTRMSNVTGACLPLDDIIAEAHRYGAVVVVDACQSIVHENIDVRKQDIDFLVFSAHKLYGPNGVGVLYGKYNCLEALPPYQTGGEMIEEVRLTETTFQLPPHRFEAGTPVIAEVIAFGDTLDYLQQVDFQGAQEHEEVLLRDAICMVEGTPGFSVIAGGRRSQALFSFVHEKIHPSDIGAILDQCGVAVRAGHHCAQPLMKHLNLAATVRVSFGMYNTAADLEALAYGLDKVITLLG